MMGRVKIEIKKIENLANRKITYSKRRNGIIKKAHELSVLCDSKVAVIMYSPSGQVTTFCKDKRLLDDINQLAKEHGRTETRGHENVESVNTAIHKLKEEEDVEGLGNNLSDLQLENQNLKARLKKNELELEVFKQQLKTYTGAFEQNSREQRASGSLDKILHGTNTWDEILAIIGD